MNAQIRKFGNLLLDLFFPRKCAVCGDVTPDGGVICSECNESLEREYNCRSFKNISFISAVSYNDVTRSIVLGAKVNRDGNKIDFMAQEIFATLKQFTNLDFDYILPVPVSKDTRSKRGFNHAEKLAQMIQQLSGIAYLNAFRKTRDTAQQKYLTQRQRRINVKGAFALLPGVELSGKRVIIVDDVTTTGVTLTELARIALGSGCSYVVCASFAKSKADR